MIAVAVTDTMKVTVNVITATAPVDIPELSDSSTFGALSPAKYSTYYLKHCH